MIFSFLEFNIVFISCLDTFASKSMLILSLIKLGNSLIIFMISQIFVAIGLLKCCFLTLIISLKDLLTLEPSFLLFSQIMLMFLVWPVYLWKSLVFLSLSQNNMVLLFSFVSFPYWKVGLFSLPALWEDWFHLSKTPLLYYYKRFLIHFLTSFKSFWTNLSAYSTNSPFTLFRLSMNNFMSLSSLLQS